MAGIAAERSAERSADSEGTLIDGRYAVDADRALAGFDTPAAKAVAVRDAHDPSRHLFGLVQAPQLPHRGRVAKALLADPVPHLVNPLAQAVVPLGRGSGERLVTVFEAPGGPALQTAGGAPVQLGMNALMRSLLPCLLKALGVLHARDICHRGIRPQNIFFCGPDGGDLLVGECVSTPAGLGQPAVYEPLERAMADEGGRGEGEPGADMFALGATLLACFLGRDPGAGRDPEKLLLARLAQGSFWALAAGRDVPGALGIALRGLLNDDPGERWTIEHLLNWMDSAVPQRRSVQQLWTFTRPVYFRRTTISDRRLLARAFSRHVKDAASFLRGLDFGRWAQSFISSELFTDRHERLLAVEPAGTFAEGVQDDEALVARAAAHLDPLGPVRFRGLAVYADGIGPALARAFASRDRQRLDAFKQLLRPSALPAALALMADRNPVVQRIAFDLEAALRRARDDAPGAGLERLLYDLNPSLPCQSPLVQGRWAATPQQLLETLDDLAAGQGQLAGLLDRHVLAFFASRDPHAQHYVARFAHVHGDAERGLFALAELLAFLQKTHGPEKLNNLCARIAEALKPLLRQLRKEDRRKAAIGRLDQLAAQGDLSRLIQGVDVLRLRREDREEYEHVRARLARLDERRQRLVRRIQPTDPDAMLVGYRIAAVVAWGGLALSAILAGGA